MDFDITRNVYGNKPNKIVFGGKRDLMIGVTMKFLLLSKKKLQHEIFLFSQTKLLIHLLGILRLEK